MNHLVRFRQTISNISFVAIALPGLIGLSGYIILREFLEFEVYIAAGAAFVVYSVGVFISYSMLIGSIFTPIEKIWQAIWHVSPNKADVAAPTIDDIKIGRELVNALVMQVYDLASHGNKVAEATQTTPGEPSLQPMPEVTGDDFIESIPTPIFLLDKNAVIKITNQMTCNYLGLPREKIVGRAIYDVLRLSFMNEDTLDMWLKTTVQSKATDTKAWEHARLSVDGQAGVKQIDLAALYSKDSSSGLDTVITLFDRTKSYDTQDQSTSYVSMAVHELRTPLTIMRGYIEVFEDELGDKLSAEHQEFMRKMSASAQSLTAFVSNILNVARVDQNQFVLNLHEANWNEVLPEIVKDMELRAAVRNKTISLEIEPNLPTIAIDRISIYEVVSNLIDNAIKYSGQTTQIFIKARMSKDGWVETVIQDFGVGMPQSVMSGLFTRYYRSHRNKNAISGSGLGLYLVKTIVEAHGGNVWVSSKENQGSSFGFTLQPYADLKDKPTGSDGIERQASGWIKNHSMYRR